MKRASKNDNNGATTKQSDRAESVSPFDVNAEEVFTSAPRAIVESEKDKGGPGTRKLPSKGGESSMLFALGTLPSLANEPSPVESADGSRGAPAASANTETSGLVDIRALREGFKQNEDRSEDDILSVEAEAFMPVLSLHAGGMGRKKKFAIIGASGVLAAGLIIALVFAFSGGGKEDKVNEQIAALQKQIEELRARGGGGTDKEAALEAELAKAREQDSAANLASGQGGESTSGKGSDDAQSDVRKNDGKSKSQKSRPKDSSTGQPAAPSENSSTTPKKGPSSELDDLLGGSNLSAFSNKKKSGSSDGPGASGGSAKKSLDREDVQRGLNAVAARVKACGRGESGTVNMKVVIGSNGTVLSAQSTGIHAGTQVGSCAARAVKSAKFPKSQNSMTVSYPFKL